MSIFTPADVIASYKTHGDAWMRFDLLKKRTPKNGNVVTYVPILVRKANSETYGRLVLKFIMQIVSNKPKTFKGNGNNTNDQSKKKLSIAFRQITREDFERSTVHKSETYDKFIESSSELMKALTIIDNSFQKLCEKYESDLSNITTNKTICSIKQTERKMSDEEKLAYNSFSEDEKKKINVKNWRMQLDTPIFRITIPYHNASGRIGIYDETNKKHNDIVYNAKKEIMVNGKKVYQIAQIETKHSKEALTVHNIAKFITYLSVLHGSVEFDSCVLSSFGRSLSTKFRQILVARHPPVAYDDSIGEDDMNEMSSYAANLGNDEVYNDNDDNETAPDTINKVSKNKRSNKAIMDSLANDDEQYTMVDDPAEELKEPEDNADEESLPVAPMKPKKSNDIPKPSLAVPPKSNPQKNNKTVESSNIKPLVKPTQKNNVIAEVEPEDETENSDDGEPLMIQPLMPKGKNNTKPKPPKQKLDDDMDDS